MQKIKEREIAIQHCSIAMRELQQSVTADEGGKFTEKHSKEYVLIKSIKDYTVFLYYTLSRRVFLGIHILG